MSARRSVAWMAAAQGSYFALQFGGSIILACYLTLQPMWISPFMKKVVGHDNFGLAHTTSVMSVLASLVDAGLDKSGIEVAYFGNAGQSAIEGQYMVSGQIALRDMGIGGIPVTNVENACASGSTSVLSLTEISARRIGTRSRSR